MSVRFVVLFLMDEMPETVAIIRWVVSLWSAEVVGGRAVRGGGKIKKTIGGEQLGNWEATKATS